MAFLEINNPEGTSAVKRPFRISDLQDLWSGITSLFKPIKGELFRIISGFNIEGVTYSPGAVYHEGKIYEYDGSKPITTATSEVYFAKIAIDTRQFESGNSYPFAYKYVCGGSSFASDSGYVSQVASTSFRANISRYKSYLGVGSIATDKLEDGCVTTDKLEDDAVTLSKLASNITGSGLVNQVASDDVVLPVTGNTGNVTTVKLSDLVYTDTYGIPRLKGLFLNITGERLEHTLRLDCEGYFTGDFFDIFSLFVHIACGYSVTLSIECTNVAFRGFNMARTVPLLKSLVTNEDGNGNAVRREFLVNFRRGYAGTAVPLNVVYTEEFR